MALALADHSQFCTLPSDLVLEKLAYVGVVGLLSI